MTQIYITWLQLIFGNTLLYPISVRDFPGPEHSVFFIFIVDIISRSALVGFSRLHASGYYYRKGPVCFVLKFCSQYLYSELSILFLFILLQETPA